MNKRLFYPALLVVLVSAMAPLIRAQYADMDSETEETETDGIEKKRPGVWHSPAKDNPTEQLAYATELEKRKGHARKTRKAYADLVHEWHQSPEAAIAQQRYAELLEEAGDYVKAFEEYQYLIHYFGGQFPYHKVVDAQYRIANVLLKQRRMRFLFGGFSDSEAALPLFEQVLENAPAGEHAVDSRYQIAQINLRIGELDTAVDALDALLKNPDLTRERRAEIAFERAMALAQLAARNRRSEHHLDEAIRALTSFTAVYPKEGEKTTEATRRLDECRARKVNLLWQRALFYDEIRQEPKAAMIAYEAFVQECPWAIQVEQAIQRIKALRKQVESTDEVY